MNELTKALEELTASKAKSDILWTVSRYVTLIDGYHHYINKDERDYTKQECITMKEKAIKKLEAQIEAHEDITAKGVTANTEYFKVELTATQEGYKVTKSRIANEIIIYSDYVNVYNLKEANELFGKCVDWANDMDNILNGKEFN